MSQIVAVCAGLGPMRKFRGVAFWSIDCASSSSAPTYICVTLDALELDNARELDTVDSLDSNLSFDFEERCMEEAVHEDWLPRADRAL